MNEIMKQLWETTTKTVVPREGDYSCVSSKNISDFGYAVVDEVLRDPRIYILFEKDRSGYDDVEIEFVGWTSDIEIVRGWNTSGGMHKCRWSVSLDPKNMKVKS